MGCGNHLTPGNPFASYTIKNESVLLSTSLFFWSRLKSSNLKFWYCNFVIFLNNHIDYLFWSRLIFGSATVVKCDHCIRRRLDKKLQVSSHEWLLNWPSSKLGNKYEQLIAIDWKKRTRAIQHSCKVQFKQLSRQLVHLGN